MWYKQFNLKHCSAMEPQTTDLGPPATILTLVTVLTKELNIFSGPLVTILTNRHQGIVSICKLHSLHQNHILSLPNLDKGSGRMFRRQILGWVEKKILGPSRLGPQETILHPSHQILRMCILYVSGSDRGGKASHKETSNITIVLGNTNLSIYFLSVHWALYRIPHHHPVPFCNTSRRVKYKDPKVLLNRSKHLRSTKPKRPEANIVPGPPYRQLGPEIGPSMTTAILRWVHRVQCCNMATITATYCRCPIGGRKDWEG